MTILLWSLAILGGWLACAFFNAALLGFIDRVASESGDIEEPMFYGIVAFGPVGLLFLIFISLILLSIDGVGYLYKKLFRVNPFVRVYELARYK